MKYFNKKIEQQIDNYELELPENDWEILSRKINQKKRKIQIWRYAAAASTTLLIGLGIVAFITQNMQSTQFYTDNNSENSDTGGKTQNTGTSSANADLKSMPAKPQVHAANLDKLEQTLHHYAETEQAQAENLHRQQPSVCNQPPQISIEEAEKLMNEKETQSAKQEIKNQQSKNIYYASLLASAAPASFSFGEQKLPIRKYLLSPSYQNAMEKTSYSDVKHDLPLTFGVNFGIPIAKRFYFNTGINYSFIHSKTSIYDIDNNKLISVDNQNLHYLGVPAVFLYRIIDGKIFKLYIAAGGAAEKGLIETHSKKNFGNEQSVIESLPSKKIDGFQFLLNANLGASISLSRVVGIYIEPGFAWYIPAKKYIQPVSSRTEHPYFFNISAGLRFDFRAKK
ncbi:MAG: PorT family protein [Prevotellaceae bacterium]|jgi:hypothetical protein|nr:PorT family protein [Prevotellaceae bacterium]